MKACVVWLVVILPLAWGVTRSVQKSLPLFAGEAETPVRAPIK